MMKTDGLIFDIDGTLWDSTEKVAAAYNRCLAGLKPSFGTPHITSDILKKEFGKPMEVIAHDLFPSLSEEECRTLLKALCREEDTSLRRDPPSPYPGVREMVQSLSAELPLFIVSNCQAGYAELFLEKTSLVPYFRDHFCPDDTGELKAGNIRMVTERFGLKDPCYIGDTMGDFLACREAFCPFIFASYGFGEVPSPDYTIKQPLDLLKL